MLQASYNFLIQIICFNAGSISFTRNVIFEVGDVLQLFYKQEGHDGPVTLTWVYIALREPDLELIQANILTKIHND